MQITLTETGKRFNAEWIFRNLTYVFEDHQAVAVLGRNGSGKSTLLQIVAGSLHPTTGIVKYSVAGNEIPQEQVYKYLSIVAPYQELIEDFTLQEMVDFHFSFKSIIPGQTVLKLVEMLGFQGTGKKPIRQFSSGMKQRLKLALAILSDVPLLLLDEPTMNLDRAGIEWFQNILETFAGNRTILVCSNIQHEETSFCKRQLFIEEYKK